MMLATVYKTLPLFVVFFILTGLVACNTGNDAKAKDGEASTATADSVIALIELPAQGKLDPAEAERLRRACQAFYDTILRPKGFNGGILVAKEGNIVYEQYSGTAFVGGFDTVKATTPFHIASVTKTFTAMAVLQLWQKGKLNIDEEVSKYLPGFNYTGVTIRTLLNHRSGLPNYTHFLEPMGWDNTKPITNEQILQFMTERRAQMENTWPPNVKFSYCNTNYALLAVIIEKVSGKSYADYLQQHFFAPLGMQQSSVFKLADTLTATPSFDWKGRLMPFNFLDAVYGDKNIYTTPRDLLLWDRALYSGKLFTPETLTQAFAPYSNEKPGVKNYGLGWRMNMYPNGKKIIFHNGWWHGNNAVFIRLLDEKATIIVLGNKFTRAIYAARQLANLFGDYNIPEEEGEETENGKMPDSLLTLPQMLKDSLPKLQLRKKVPTAKDSALQRMFKDEHRAKFEQQAKQAEQ